jgi:hypothetical protein
MKLSVVYQPPVSARTKAVLTAAGATVNDFTRLLEKVTSL